MNKTEIEVVKKRLLRSLSSLSESLGIPITYEDELKTDNSCAEIWFNYETVVSILVEHKSNKNKDDHDYDNIDDYDNSEYYDIKDIEEYDVSKAKICIKNDYKDDPIYLAHELGHYMAIKRNNDNSEYSADREAIKLCKMILTKQEYQKISMHLLINSEFSDEEILEEVMKDPDNIKNNLHYLKEQLAILKNSRR